MEIFRDIEQGTPEWFAIRCGCVTASEFHTVMAKGEGKTRRTYLLKLAGEIITGKPAITYSNASMLRGNQMEPEARILYEMTTGNTTEQVGFIKATNEIGYSPDGLINKNGLLEIKTAEPHLQIPILLADIVPKKHIGQLQGGLWISEREWIDFVSYWPGLPIFIKRVYRDESQIEEIKKAVYLFLAELRDVVSKINKM